MHSSPAAALAALVVVLLAVPTVKSHSWVEELRVIDPKAGLFTDARGYIRNNTKRTDPKGFSDPLMVHILPTLGQPSIEQRDIIPESDTNGISHNDTMCKLTQQNQFQSDGSPRLQAAPGALVALRYAENGHVSLPENQKGKPSNRGTVYIYGTTKPKSPELFLDIFGQWTADGNGGDKRGRLLATQPYDDGHCYQVNAGAISTARQSQYPHSPDPNSGLDLMCQNDISLPTDIAVGQPYTIYWVWDWPTAAGADPNLPNGKAEIYTSCLDVDIIAKAASKRRVKGRQAPPPSPSATSMGHLNSAAIPAYLSSLTASPAPAGATGAISAPAPKPDPTTSAAQVATPNSAGLVSYIENAVSAAVAAQVPKMPLTVTVDVVSSMISPNAAGAGVPAATQAAASAVSITAAAPPVETAPASTQAASQAPASMPPTASMLLINPPILSASPPASTGGALPAFSGTASPVVASAIVASPSPAIQNGTTGAKSQRGCSAKSCKSKRQSRIFGKKSGGHR